MSDFDEEAERERLREKYERDQEKREATEKMSDLLLKGATMTNAHCQECGDPIFRYDGREFCPTCQRIVAGDGDAEGESDTDASGADTGRDGTEADAGRDGTGSESDEATANGDDPHIEVKTPTGPPATTADAVDDADAARAGADRPVGADASGADHRAGADATEETGPDPGASPQPQQPPQSPPDAPATGGDASLSTARESLVRTLTAQARRAETCEDPRQARDHLEAAREAAETLAVLSA